MSKRTEKLEALFEAALALESAAQQQAYLDRVCPDPDLRREVESLLIAHRNPDSLLVPGREAADPRVGVPITEQPGDQIGRYKLLEKLGEGGFGVVYMAEQREPVKRRVALKIIKVGMDTREVVARFEAERQALALMDHPNIAKVFDAGATEGPVAAGVPPAVEPGVPPGGSSVAISKAPESSQPDPGGKMPPSTAGRMPAATLSAGRPYFVMELVRGIRITDYCDQNQLGLEERLKLFMQVCHAVQHAHQKGIIHRDLKPSNILVTLHDGVPVPKVIDFGIAKATQQELTEKTLFTQFHQFIGTPSYMSPEQAELSGLDIDTRSDIYSLGVLLYELLAGKPPFDGQELLKAGLDEMRRTLREVEPIKPSKVVERESELRVERSQKAGAPARSTLNPQLKPLSTDLDWIVMKCLEKDRTRRYDTANELATDIQRHLSNEPVVARPPSAAYRFQTMVRRNKVVFVAGAGIATTLMFGLGLFIWQFVEKEKAYQRAQVEAAKSQTVATFHKDMIWSMRPSIAMGRDTTLLHEFAERTFAQLGKDLKSQPAVEIELRAALGRVFLTLGDYPKAEQLYQETLPRMRDLLGTEHPDVADLLQNYAEVLHGREKYKEAEAMAREALTLNRKLRGKEHPDVAYSLMLIGNALGASAASRGDLDQAELLLRQSLAIYQKLHGPEHRDVAVVLNNFAKVLELQGRPSKAGPMYQQALAMAKRLLGDVDPLVVMLTKDLAGFQLIHGNFDEVEKSYRELLSTQRKLLGNENRHVARTLAELAGALINNGRSAEAEPLARESLALHQRLYGSEHIDVAKNQNDLGAALMNLNRHAEAEPLMSEALATARKLLPPDDPVVIVGIQNLGLVLAAEEKYGEAERLFREQVAFASKTLPYEPAKLGYTSAKRTNQQPTYVVKVAGALSAPTLDDALGNLADAVYRQRKYPEAETLYREKLQRLRAGRSLEDKDIVSTSASLGRLLADWAWAEREQAGRAVPSALAGGIEPSGAVRTPRSTSAAPRAPVELAREGERLLRESLADRIKRTNATPWKTSELKSRLGSALVSLAVTDPELGSTIREAKFAESEPLLLEGNEAVQQHASADSKYKRDTLERLIRLYEAWNKPDRAAEWRTKLESFDHKRAEPKSASTQEAPPMKR